MIVAVAVGLRRSGTNAGSGVVGVRSVMPTPPTRPIDRRSGGPVTDLTPGRIRRHRCQRPAHGPACGQALRRSTMAAGREWACRCTVDPCGRTVAWRRRRGGRPTTARPGVGHARRSGASRRGRAGDRASAAIGAGHAGGQGICATLMRDPRRTARGRDACRSPRFGRPADGVDAPRGPSSEPEPPHQDDRRCPASTTPPITPSHPGSRARHLVGGLRQRVHTTVVRGGLGPVDPDSAIGSPVAAGLPVPGGPLIQDRDSATETAEIVLNGYNQDLWRGVTGRMADGRIRLRP